MRASGAAVIPWAKTLRAIVTVNASTRSFVCGSPAASITTTPKTIDARPRGPNQPRRSTVGGRACAPIIAIATGIILTTVRLKTA